MKKSFFKSYKNRLTILVVLLLVLSATGLLARVYNYIMYQPCKEKCITYLDKAFKQSSNLFLTLSSAKATVAVIEGSTLNLNAVAGVNIQSGDAVQPLYDIIDIAWKGSLFSLASISIQKFFFELFKLKLLNYFLVIGFIFLIPVLIKKNIATRFCYRVAKIVLVIAFSVYCLFPLGILVVSNISDYLNKNYNQVAIKELNEEIRNLKAISSTILETENNSSAAKESKWNFKSISQNIEKKMLGIKDSFRFFSGKIKKISSKVVHLIVTILVIIFIEVIILPIFFLILFWYLIKSFWEKSIFAFTTK